MMQMPSRVALQAGREESEQAAGAVYLLSLSHRQWLDTVSAGDLHLAPTLFQLLSSGLGPLPKPLRLLASPLTSS